MELKDKEVQYDHRSVISRAEMELNKAFKKNQLHQEVFRDELQNITIQANRQNSQYANDLEDLKISVKKLDKQWMLQHKKLNNNTAQISLDTCVDVIDSDDYFRLKKLVVVVTLVKQSGEFGNGTGVVINKEGWILSCAHVFKNMAQYPFVMYSHMDKWVECEVVKDGNNFDLTILKPKESIELKEWALFREKVKVDISSMMWSICHPGNQQYSLVKGYVSFPCHTLRSDKLPGYSRRQKLVLVNGLHVEGGASGGPVFDNEGKVIGIISFRNNNYTAVIHPKIVCKFVKEFLD